MHFADVSALAVPDIPSPPLCEAPVPSEPASLSREADALTIFPMDPIYTAPSDGEPVDFMLEVDQVISGIDPAPHHPALCPPLPSDIASGSPLPPPPALCTPLGFTGAGSVLPQRLGVNAHATAMPAPTSALLGRRGLAWAHHIKLAAREEFKELRRAELEACGEGERTRRRKRNDTAMSAREKYRRRLQKNQDSAAAARYAQDAYIANLEAQAERYDAEATQAECALRRTQAECDYQMRLHPGLINYHARLVAEVRRLRLETGCPDDTTAPAAQTGEFAACLGLAAGRVDGVKFPAAL